MASPGSKAGRCLARSSSIFRTRPLEARTRSGLGALTVGLLRAVHWMDRRRSANFAGAFMRKAGPLLKEHRLGRENLRAAYPEKSDAEIEKILGGVWDNLGRIMVEFAHLDEFSVAGLGPQTRDTITYTPETAA